MPRIESDSRAVQYRGMLGYTVRRLMIDQLGKNPKICEFCGKRGRTVIHHKKYNGATLYDLAFVCSKCNNQTENRNLV